jgi:diacylglycerol kinase family enzyme
LPSILLVNPKSGSLERDASLEQRTVDAARAHDPQVQVLECPPDEIAARARAAAATPGMLVLVSGGDGTLGTAAGALAGTGAVLGAIPTGTWNHFSRDLGIVQADVDAAMHVAYHGRTARVDLGRAGDRIFINSCSIGVYPRVVEDREALEPAVGRVFAWTKALSMAWEQFPVERVRVSVDGGPWTALDTPLFFVGNNRYSITMPGAGRRDRLDAGVLWVCVARAGTQLQLLAQTITTWILGIDEAEGIDAFECRSLRLAGDGPTLKIAADGEPFEAPSPLEITTLPGALQVRVPAGQ